MATNGDRPTDLAMSGDTIAPTILYPLESGDQEVYDAAAAVITRRFKEGCHHVGAAVRDTDGEIFAGVHLQGVVGEPAVCAEKVAIGSAMTDGDRQIDLSVAIRHPKPHETDGRLFVLPPCGACRELIADYGSKNTWVILEVNGALFRARITDLLPMRRWQRGAALPG